jgi:hypothetical protein
MRALVLLFALVSQANAPPERLAILSSVVKPERDPETTAVNVDASCVYVAGFAAGVQTVPRAELSERALDEALRNCGADARCLSVRLEERSIDLAALVVVNLSSSPPLITLRLLRTQGAKVLAERAVSAPREGPPVLDVVSRELASLLESGGYPVLGRVNVETNPENTNVRFEASGVVQHAASIFLVPPGVHRVSLGADDHESASTSIRVERLKESTLAVRLEPEPALYERWWFWTIAGAAVVTAVAGTLVLARDPGRLRLCQHDVDETCSEAP